MVGWWGGRAALELGGGRYGGEGVVGGRLHGARFEAEDGLSTEKAALDWEEMGRSGVGMWVEG